MAESNFVDYVKIYCRSGKGGRGSMHMHRAKYVPNGGPDGGDGGRGGHVYLRGNRNYWTLLHLRYDRHVFAGHGGNGSKCRSTGKDGEDKYIEVPCGTVVYNADTGEYVCDVTDEFRSKVIDYFINSYISSIIMPVSSIINFINLSYISIFKSYNPVIR